MFTAAEASRELVEPSLIPLVRGGGPGLFAQHVISICPTFCTAAMGLIAHWNPNPKSPHHGPSSALGRAEPLTRESFHLRRSARVVHHASARQDARSVLRAATALYFGV